MAPSRLIFVVQNTLVSEPNKSVKNIASSTLQFTPISLTTSEAPTDIQKYTIIGMITATEK